ncbi:hypothetical protein V8E54_002493 [Elaphomyces granulatus]
MPGFTVLWKPGLWVFDRSGLYDSEELDIHKELEPFAKAIVDYALKTDPELGLLKCIHQTWEVTSRAREKQLDSLSDVQQSNSAVDWHYAVYGDRGASSLMNAFKSNSASVINA